jgi:osmotically-inducible protein OsmY
MLIHSISQQGDIMKSPINFIVAVTICTIGFLAPASVSAETQTVESRSDVSATIDTPADNTKKNVRDRNEATLTPPAQAEGSKQDVEVTRRIRKALVADKALSTNAKNIKIITLNGKVTLRGPVETTREQKSIVKKARKTAGVKGVTSELEVTRP